MLFRRVSLVLMIVCLALGARPLHTQAPTTASDYPDTRFELYGGYGYLHPFNSYVNSIPYVSVSNLNATASATGYFNHWLGLQVEGVYFSGALEHQQFIPRCGKSQCDDHFVSAEAGPVVRWQLGPVVPFVHLLGGGVRMNGPAAQPITWGGGVTGGGGIDLVLPFWNHALAIRPIQADMIYAHAHFPPVPAGDPAQYFGGVGDLKAVHLSGGLVFRFGEPTPVQAVMLGCTADPVSVHPGDPVTITGSTLYLNPKQKAEFTWTTNGGRITSQGETATIDTTGLAPGQYTVSGHVAQGPRASQQASCVAPLTVKPFEPPTLTCSANPSTATAGTPVEISTVGTSPQNRPLTYSYTASAGQITSHGPTATLSTAGLGAGVISVGCNAVDDLGLAASAITNVTLNALPAPVIPQTQNLCSLSFARDRRRPVRVDNEAKGCLDDIALTLQQNSDAHLVLIGSAPAGDAATAAAERAFNARQYLVHERGIDAGRIELRTGGDGARFVSSVLVPVGATFDESGSQAVDVNSIPHHGQAYGMPNAKTTRPRQRSQPPALPQSSLPPPQ